MTMPDMPTAAGILQAGIDHLAERAVTYDKPQGERSVGKVIAMFNELIAEKLKEPLSEEDGWNFMELLKLVRSKQGAYKADSFEDRACYAALAAEAAFRDRVALPMIGECCGGNREHKLAPDLGAIDLGRRREAVSELFGEVEKALFGGKAPLDLSAMGVRTPVGADLRFDQTGRQEAVEQNGNTGEHYLPEGLSWDDAPADAIALVAGDGHGDTLFVWVPALEGHVCGRVALAFGSQPAGSYQGCELSHPASVWRIAARRPEVTA